MIAHPDEHRKNKEAGRRITETEGASAGRDGNRALPQTP
jgi:hypothetical protein